MTACPTDPQRPHGFLVRGALLQTPAPDALKQADLSPLDVTGYGSLDERLAEGHEIDDDERALMQRALDENSVIIAQMQPFFKGEGASDEGETLH